MSLLTIILCLLFLDKILYVLGMIIVYTLAGISIIFGKWIMASCAMCKKSLGSENFGTRNNGEKICYSCCAENDKECMRVYGKNTLYLVKDFKNDWYIQNWPGTLKIRAGIIKVSHHNMAGKRYDTWFNFDGYQWHGVTYGDNTQICHVKKTKVKV